MPDVPGPIEVLNPAEFALAPLPPAAALPATPEEAEFDALAAELDRDLAELTGALDQDWRTELEALHAEAEEGVYQDPLTVSDDELAEAEAAAAEADGQILEAYDEIPGEAWRNLPEPFTPPPEEGGFVVIEDPARVPAPGLPAPVLPVPPGPITASVHLENVTRGGSAEFWVGDGWTLDFRGPALQALTCSGSHEGVPFGPASYGLTDNYGRFDIAGVMSEAERGSWIQRWYIGGVLCTPVLEFTVF